MPSMNDIKRRRASVTSTGQITKAMKLVSTVKLQKAKKNAEDSKEYFESMQKTISSLLLKCGTIDNEFMVTKTEGKDLVLVLSSNRGLAGGYNGNVFKAIVNEGFSKENTVFMTIGSKVRDQLTMRGYEVIKDFGDIGEIPMFADAVNVCKELMTSFKSDDIKSIHIAYTYFKNTVSHIPTVSMLLPVDKDNYSKLTEEELIGDDTKPTTNIMNFEMDENEALEFLIPQYLTSMIYGAMVQSLASENGARMQAMDSATSNAEEMIDHLTLLYNRARQGSITQELTEIIAGADAIN